MTTASTALQATEAVGSAIPRWDTRRITKDSVSVVICAYTEDRWGELAKAMSSVLHQSVPALEVILVVDHNHKLFLRAQERFPGQKIIVNKNARGLSGARNAGIVASAGSIVAFLDDDAVAAPDWIERLLAGYRDPQVHGVGGAIRPDWAGPRPGWFPEEFEWVVGCTYRGVPTSPSPIRNLIGANMSFRKNVLVATGGFNSAIGQVGTSMLRCDDTEFCIRASRAMGDGVLMFEPDSLVYHSVPKNRMTWSYFHRRCFTEGQAKAVIARLVGAQRGLSAEQNHALRTLPMGVLRGVQDVLARGDLAGLARSGAIVAGLVFTVAGYLAGSIQGRTKVIKMPGKAELGTA